MTDTTNHFSSPCSPTSSALGLQPATHAQSRIPEMPPVTKMEQTSPAVVPDTNTLFVPQFLPAAVKGTPRLKGCERHAFGSRGSHQLIPNSAAHDEKG